MNRSASQSYPGEKLLAEDSGTPESSFPWDYRPKVSLNQTADHIALEKILNQ